MAVQTGRLLIVDGHAYAYRAYHAIRSLTGPDGSPTNGIFGFVKALGKLRAQVEPEYGLVVWDGGLARERLEAHPAYKAQRPPMPESLGRQIEGMQEYLRGAGVASHCREGVEADDWIATVTRAAVGQGGTVIIASPDKDFMQLVGERVGLLNPNDKTPAVWSAAEVRERAGVEPEQIVDWLSLVGDSVDNIPGVPGVGEKTAAELLRRFGTIEAIYMRLTEITSDRLRAALAQAEAVVRRNRDLIRLNDQLPERVDLEQLRLRAENRELLGEMFARWGFRSLREEMAKAAPAQGELF